MRKKIETAYIHIGLPKTGTRSLQFALNNSHGKLRENGILYPGRIEKHIAHNVLLCNTTLLDVPMKPKNPIIAKFKIRQASKILLKIKKDIETFSGDVMIVSGELFSELDRENCRKILEYFSQYCKKITVCAYIRNPLDFTVSMIAHRVNTSSIRTIEHFERPGRIDTLPLNKERLSNWVDEAGLANMLPVPYDRKRLIGGSTVTDFLARTRIDGNLVEIPPEESNPSLTMTGMFVKNEMNKFALSKGFSLGKIRYLHSLPGPRFLPSKHFVEAMQKRCREDLDWISATFAIDLANGSGGHRGPWQDYFTDEVKTVLKDMLDRGCGFSSEMQEQAFREVAGGSLSGRIFAPQGPGSAVPCRRRQFGA